MQNNLKMKRASASKPNTRSESIRGRGRGRGTGQHGRLQIYHNEEKDSEDQPVMQIDNQKETVQESQDTTFEMPDDLELSQRESILEPIMEEDSMNHGSIHSGDTVVRGNCPELLRTRMSVNLFVSPSDDQPDKLLFGAGKKWFAKMLDADSTCKIIPWFEDDKDEGAIQCYKDIPTTISKFKKYFCRSRPKVEGGSVYMEVFMLHTRPIIDIKEDIEWWMKKEKITLYVKTIQAELTTRLGWLLFSFPEMNVKAFSTELTSLMGETISARYKPILTDKWDTSLDSKSRLKAIHLECDKKVESKVKMKLATFYSSSSKNFPMGIRMRLIPEFREIKGNQLIVQKVANLRAKQAHFLQAITSITSDDIINLDVTTSSSPKTLRQRIMEIKSWSGTESTLFHAVNESWDGNKTVFTFTPPHAENASLIVQALIPYMINHHGEGIKDFFDPNMLLEKDDWTWDEERKTLDNPQTRTIEGIAGADTDYDFLEHIKQNAPTMNSLKPIPNPTDATNLTATHLDRILAGVEVDSVSTLGTPHTPKHKYTPQSIATTTGSSGSSLSPSLSGQSISSIDSRVSLIETKINSLEETISNSIQNSMELLLSKLQSTGDSSSGESL